MIKSKYFWIATLFVSLVPLFLIDISEHILSFKYEVRDEFIYAAQNTYNLNTEQKAQILDKALDRNFTLNFLIYTKAFLSLIFLATGFYLFRLFRIKENSKTFKPVILFASVLILITSTKLIYILINSDSKIKILTIEETASSLDQLINDNFKDKVVYVDFWGTTCGPCLFEFQNFTKPMKDRYRSNKGVAFLYVAQGNQYIWKRQLDKYEVEGFHVFLNEEQYNSVYRNSIANDTGMVFMPRYLIYNQGKVAINDAKRPSDEDSLYVQIDKYLLR